MSGIREAWEGMEKKLGIDGGARVNGRTQNEAIGETIKNNPMSIRGDRRPVARNPRKESTFVEDTFDTIVGLIDALMNLRGDKRRR